MQAFDAGICGGCQRTRFPTDSWLERWILPKSIKLVSSLEVQIAETLKSLDPPRTWAFERAIYELLSLVRPDTEVGGKSREEPVPWMPMAGRKGIGIASQDAGRILNTQHHLIQLRNRILSDDLPHRHQHHHLRAERSAA